MNLQVFLLVATILILSLCCKPSLSGEIDEGEEGTFVFHSRNVQFNEEDCHPAGKGSKGSKPECLDTTLMTYMYNLQIINPESVITLATKNKLDKICVNISKTIHKMQNYMKTCILQPQQEEYAHLLKGVTALHKKLCTSDPYHKMFLEHKKCLAQLQSEFGSCNGPADWSDNADRRKVCKAYQEIADCYYIKTSVLCGNVAADVFKELVNAVIDSVITVDCSNKSIAYNNLSNQMTREYNLNQNLSAISGISLSRNSNLILIICNTLIVLKLKLGD